MRCLEDQTGVHTKINPTQSSRKEFTTDQAPPRATHADPGADRQSDTLVRETEVTVVAVVTVPLRSFGGRLPTAFTCLSVGGGGEPFNLETIHFTYHFTHCTALQPSCDP